MDKDEEIARLHLIIARQTEVFKEDFKKEISYYKNKLERLEKKLESYDQIINIHKTLGGK